MQIDLTVIVKPEQESDKNLIQKRLNEALKEKTGESENAEFVFVKKSIDARHGQVKLVLRYKAFVGESASSAAKKDFSWRKAAGGKKVLVVGSGPSGLFASFKLLEKGIQPVIIERGKNTSDRKRDIAAISTQGIVGSDSNYCFGEGGAGTFSDGKLYTRSNKRGDIGEVLRIFNHFGADKKILTDAHPHIGTNRLPEIINAMREKIIELGGEIHFNTRVTDFIIEEASAKKIIRGVVAKDLLTGEKKEFAGDAVILATGHSASDIYELLNDVSPESLEAKTFAVGVRVEHPRELIDRIQYHSSEEAKNLGAAEYRLTTQVDGHGVYSFCMCPGGFVVPSATGPEEIVVNGMSSAGRNSAWSNAAIVVETRPEDIEGEGNLKGLYFRSGLEHETYLHGGASVGGDMQKKFQAAPAQLLTDFLAGRESVELPRSSYTPGLVSSRLDEWLPKQIVSRLKKGFMDFDKKMRGFICDKALLIASETRTSTPIRIRRDRETFECAGIGHLYPCGEGSGYSGGIVSSAMDGISAAEHLIPAI